MGDLVEFCAGIAPGGIVLGHQREEALVVGRFEEVDHLMDDHIFEQIFGLLYRFGVQTDVARLVVAASPVRFHAAGGSSRLPERFAVVSAILDALERLCR